MFPILRQTLDSDLASHLITYGESTIDCDVLVVLDDLAAHSPIQAVSSKACILFLLETPSVYRPNRRFIRQFEEIHTYRKDINSRRVKQITACAPWHIGVSRRLVDGKMILDAEGEQLPDPGSAVLPLFPVAAPHPSPQPLVQLQHLPIGVTDPEIVQPSHHIAP